MEKMHVAPSANHAASGTTAAKQRASQGAPGQAASAGDFLGLLTALGDSLLSGSETDTAGQGLLSQADQQLPSTLATPITSNAETAPGALMSSLLALQAGFTGAANPTQLSQTQTQAPAALQSMATVQLGAGKNHNPLSTLPTSTATALPTATAGLPLATGQMPNAMQTFLGEGVAAGSRSVAALSSGGELGLVAQTAALDGALESESAQTLGLGKKIPGRNFAAASSVPTTEAWAGRSAASQRLDALEQRSTAQMANASNVAPTLVQTAINNAQPQPAHDWLPAGNHLPSTFNEATAAPSSETLGGLLAGQGQGAGRGNEGGRGTSAGQNPDAQGVYGLSGPSTDAATLAENPMFDLANALPTEDSVAEQVSYWVHQNIQNAELTVEHDGHPVQVTVSLNGNEAHVSFTSDQNETRALLDASQAQLRALLESQGLVLSGMNVGESATQGQGNNPSGQRGGAPTDARTTTVEAHAPTPRPRSADIISDKAVDIFV